MSVEAVLARMTELQGAWSAPAAAAAPLAAATPAPGASDGGSGASFASLLGQATGTGGAAGAAALRGALPIGAGYPMAGSGVGGVGGIGAAGGVGTAGGPAAQMIALAQGELNAGVAEQPDGSNDSPRIAEYRTATTPSPVGPWCCYFVSWLANRAGVPVGEAGQGFAGVDALAAWAQRTGRATDTPAPGELIVWDEHIGLVTGVDPDGTIHTIEGNSSNKVSARTYGPDGGGALTYVKLAP